MIWHVDTAKDDSVNDDEGHPGQDGWPQNNNHYMVAVLPADGEYLFEKGEDFSGDAWDLYGQCMGNDSIGPTESFPNTDAYQGGAVVGTDITIKNIYQDNNDNMVFDICFGECAPGEDVPSIECCEDNVSWKDSDGTGCKEYERGWCSEAEDFADATGVSALTTCCVCKDEIFGGALPNTPDVETFPGTPATTTDDSSCVDNPLWADSEGDACDVHEESWCGEDANSFANHGITANTACCICRDSCEDDATWKDAEGDGCDEYTADWCGGAAVDYEDEQGINANMACCVCK